MEYVEAQTVRQTLWRTRPPCFLAELPQNFGMNTPAVRNKSVEDFKKILESISPETSLSTLKSDEL
jgi:hypothetical protein